MSPIVSILNAFLMSEIIRHLRNGWMAFVSRWHIVILIYIVGYTVIGIGLWPVFRKINLAFGNSDSFTKLIQKFDYAIYADLINSHPDFLPLLFSNIALLGLFYILWNNFYSAGYLFQIHQGSKKIGTFFKGGGKFVLSFCLVSLLQFVLYAIGALLLYLWFVQGGLDVLEMDNELFLIRNFYIAVTIFLVYMTFITLFRDVLRSQIIMSNDVKTWRQLSKAFMASLKIKNYILGLIFIILFAFVAIVFFNLQSFTEIMIWSLVFGFLSVFFRLSVYLFRIGSIFDIIQNK